MRSHWPEFRAKPLFSAAKSLSWIWTDRFSFLAMAETTSTSKPLKPMAADLSKSSNGGYGTAEQNARGALLSAAAAAPPAALVSLLQAHPVTPEAKNGAGDG